MTEHPAVEHGRIVDHVLVPPVGTFAIDDEVAGMITVPEDPWTSELAVSIETAWINTLNPTRDHDLRSERYLDVERHPTMTYRSTTMRARPVGAWLVTGDLTLRGVTRPVDLMVRFGGAVADDHGNIRVAFHAEGAITRREFGLTYELIKEAGGLLVGQDIDIEIDVEAVQPQ